MSATKIQCFSCHKEISIQGMIGRRDDCQFCHADLHCCKNCHFYDPKTYNECREPQAERVVEKDRANYCDQFQARTGALSTVSEKDKLREAAEALFKKK